MARIWVLIGFVMMLVGQAIAPAATAQDATPSPGQAGNLATMLQLAPDVLAGADAPPTQIVVYADLATQLEAVGISRPASIDDEDFFRWSFGLETLFYPDLFLQNALSARWQELIGYDILDIDETLEIGEPPARTLVRGRFDRAEVEAAWARLGYQVQEIDGTTVASLNEDGEFSVDNELQRYAFSRFNNAAFLPDGTLAYAPTLKGLREVIAVANGEAPSIADREEIAALVGAMDEPLVSGIILTGDFLRFESLLGPGAHDVTPLADEMPAVELALFGITAGGPVSRPMTQESPTPGIPRATFKIALLHQSAEDAQRSAEVATGRLATAQSLLSLDPLADLFESWNAFALDDPPVMVMSLVIAEDRFAQTWLRMVLTRDLPFLGW